MSDRQAVEAAVSLDGPAPELAPGHDPSVIEYAGEPDMALAYDRFHQYNRLFETDTRFLRDVLPEGGRVLDLGCGTGRHLVHLAARGYEVTGVDLSPHMLREAARKLDREGVAARRGQRRGPDYAARLLMADICRVSEMSELEQESFDAVICMFSTIGLVKGRRRRREALEGWRRLLKPGGTLVIHTHNVWYDLADPWSRRRFARRLLVSLVSRLWLSGRELGDKWMRGYRGLAKLYIHVFSLRELRRLVRWAGFSIERELLLNGPRTGPFEGRFPYFRANGFLIAARKA